ncbi:MAG: hypothetical protein H6737_13765 [Alphaproteobacteria bacterium]|nr:hypothetical protein [Alphaproteobacteria bacterium]
MRLIATAVLAAGLMGPGGMTCADRWTRDASGVVGVELVSSAHGLAVVGLWVDRPAWGRLRIGDEIVGADGVALDALSADARVGLVRGPVGERVALHILRDGLVQQVTLERTGAPSLDRRAATVVDTDTFADFDGCATKGFEVRFATDSDGRVVDVRVRGATPEDDDLECVLRRLDGMHWSAGGQYSLVVHADSTGRDWRWGRFPPPPPEPPPPPTRPDGILIRSTCHRVRVESPPPRNRRTRPNLDRRRPPYSGSFVVPRVGASTRRQRPVPSGTRA